MAASTGRTSNFGIGMGSAGLVWALPKDFPAAAINSRVTPCRTVLFGMSADGLARSQAVLKPLDGG